MVKAQTLYQLRAVEFRFHLHGRHAGYHPRVQRARTHPAERSASYNPARVLNAAVTATASEIPGVPEFRCHTENDASTGWRGSLRRCRTPPLVPLTGARPPRPDCRRPVRRYIPSCLPRRSRRCPLAAFLFHGKLLACRRDLLERYPFDTSIQYSEDIDWSYRMRNLVSALLRPRGPRPMHSHDYNLGQSYRRHYGEAEGRERWIFRNGELNSSFLRYCICRSGARCCATSAGPRGAPPWMMRLQRAAACGAEVGTLAGVRYQEEGSYGIS